MADHGKAAARAEEMAKVGYSPATDHYRASCFLCRCVALVTKDGQMAEAKQKEIALSYADRAVQLLRMAVQHGYKDANQIKNDKRLDPIRSSNDFQEVLKELQDGKMPS